MNEIKPCPLCGGNDFYYHSSTGVDLNTQWNGPLLICKNCRLRLENKNIRSVWNTRPGEDEAFKRGAEAMRKACVSAIEQEKAKHYSVQAWTLAEAFHYAQNICESVEVPK